MSAETLLRMACLAVGLVLVLGGLNSGMARPYNVTGTLGLRGVLVIAGGFVFMAAGWTGWGMGALT